VKRALALGAALATAIALGACGDDEGEARLTVSAASSLEAAFTEYAASFSGAEVRYSFAGSDELAAQIAQGAEPDVFASADALIPERLHQQGLVERPVEFAGNELVLAVPSDNEAAVGSLADLAHPGVNIVVGTASVPVGAYTRRFLERLPARRSEAILDNVRSTEPDVSSVVGKLSQGAADAGFVYITDVEGTEGELRAIGLPERLQPEIAYAAAVVAEAGDPEQADAFIQGLLSGSGARALRGAGFAPPPA
jgi:molybdate transport system substrate-binding protein